MRFDVSMIHEAACTRVRVHGEPVLGRLLSLLAVLEVDSVSWPRPAVMLDLRGLTAPLAREEELRLAAQARSALWRMKRIAVVRSGGEPPQGEGVRFFDDVETARHWLQGEA